MELVKRGRRIGIECKRADAPILTPSMRIAMTDLKPDDYASYIPAKNAISWRRKSKSCRWRNSSTRSELEKSKGFVGFHGSLDER